VKLRRKIQFPHKREIERFVDIDIDICTYPYMSTVTLGVLVQAIAALPVAAWTFNQKKPRFSIRGFSSLRCKL